MDLMHGSSLSTHTSSCCRDRDTWRADDRGKALLSLACRLDLRGVAAGRHKIMNLIGDGKLRRASISSAEHKGGFQSGF